MTGLTTRTVRVLVVDDDPRVRSGLQQLLSGAPGLGLAGTASSLQEAYQVLAATDADVVLVDVRLETVDAGLALIRDLSTALPVVALSINGAARSAALAAGATAYLEKDGEPDALLTGLRRAAAPDPGPDVTPGAIPAGLAEPAADVVARTSGSWALAVLVLATFAGPWLVWTSRIAEARGLIGWHLPLGVALWTLTPSLLAAALAVGGRAAVRDLVARITRWRVPARSYAVALGLPVALGAVAVAVTALLGGAVHLGGTLPLGAALAYLAYGTGLFLLTEEAAWRGMVLPRLLRRLRPVPASLLLGVVWGLWHLPLLHVPGESDNGLPVLGFLLLTTATSVLMTALVLAARGSVLVAALFHAALDATYAFTGVVGGDRLTFWAAVAATTTAALLTARVTVRRQVRETTGSGPSSP